jgi:subtilisin family serine protease
VAGIAIEGNPFARIVSSRYTFDYHQPRRLLTTAIAQRYAKSHYDTVEYFKRAGVRAVNMSWIWSLKEVEGILEANGITDPEERKSQTNEIFGILRDSLHEAIASAPDVLFFVAAGNSDSNVEFDEIIPSNFDLPNIVAVAAVDQAGDPTNFTSSGRNVKICANGFEVESFVPGGATLKLSGTSMASPNALNLAAKLFALDPGLKPGEVIELIEHGATPRDDDEAMLLIHPKQSIDKLRQRP